MLVPPNAADRRRVVMQIHEAQLSNTRPKKTEAFRMPRMYGVWSFLLLTGIILTFVLQKIKLWGGLQGGDEQGASQKSAVVAHQLELNRARQSVVR